MLSIFFKKIYMLIGNWSISQAEDAAEGDDAEDDAKSDADEDATASVDDDAHVRAFNIFHSLI